MRIAILCYELTGYMVSCWQALYERQGAELVGLDNGFLIPAGSGLALKQALMRFQAPPATAKAAVGVRSHAKVLERFTWAKVAEAHAALFRSLVQS